jgi:hypothetical protein
MKVSGFRDFANSLPRMKHHLLQKCSFFLIKLAALAAGGRAEQRTAEPQNIE